MNQHTITINVPEGYEPTGEYRIPKKDEYFLDIGNTAGRSVTTHSTHIILKRKAPEYKTRYCNIDDVQHVEMREDKAEFYLDSRHDIDRILEALEQTPAQSLNIIKAEAIEEAYKYAVSTGSEHCPESWLDYAKKLRGES